MRGTTMTQTLRRQNVYTHLAPAPITDPVGSVIDIDGETFVIGGAADGLEGTDRFAFALVEFDYTLISTPMDRPFGS
jgi:hypothetical protein